MKTFRMKADTTFRAENLDEAFDILRDYFKSLSSGDAALTSPFEDGEIIIEVDQDKEDKPEDELDEY